MVSGSCFCGAIRIELTGEPLKAALCHCADCRKITGSLFTYSFVVLRSQLQISGTGVPKPLSKRADSGNRIVNHFCSDCGSPLYGGKVGEDGTPDNGLAILRAGIFDDEEFLARWRPSVEVFAKRRLPWVQGIEGAEQHECMLPAASVAP
ncbi:Mss4-like protein [Aspergillus pseudoustus]|uniref:Mss4-like protein n=1 Tax=Aspergillus pseudoustus TaxID=1810923 RepID=A0ABR4I8W3_9EURO